MAGEAGSTRDLLLGLLLRHKAGLTIDELAGHLGVSRNAVRQHLAGLERDGLVAAGDVRRQVGRPSQVYQLTPAGQEQFPRQYSLLSGMVLAAVRDLHGADGTRTLLQQVAERLAGQLAGRVQGAGLRERTAAVAAIMNELGYVAEADHDAISALNCVYHHLAAEFPEVCDLDIALLERLTGARAEHVECMLRGGARCRFQMHE